MRFDLTTWIRHLRSVAGVIPEPGGGLTAGDLEAPVRAACLGGGATMIPSAPATAADPGEIALWWARSDPRVDVDAVLAAADPSRRTPEPGPASSSGSLLPRYSRQAIDVWTDADLAAMHALWWLARDRGRDDWALRLEEVRHWHLANTQPDNATNRPWAIHVFLLGGSPEDEHYAQTLLHNALAMDAEPTPLGRVLLRDAADALERHLADD